jgi:uncharacterized protein
LSPEVENPSVLKLSRVELILPRMNFSPGLIVILFLLAGCGNSDPRPLPPPSSAPPVVPAETPVPDGAQPRLPVISLWIGAEELLTELAMTPRQIRTGMMFRTEMAENEAMLFVFAGPHRAAFWMKNTQIPLSVAYIDPDGVILEIHDLHPHDTNSVEAASNQIQYVLETNQNWFRKKNVRPGMVVRTEHGTLQETFFRNRLR